MTCLPLTYGEGGRMGRRTTHPLPIDHPQSSASKPYKPPPASNHPVTMPQEKCPHFMDFRGFTNPFALAHKFGVEKDAIRSPVSVPPHHAVEALAEGLGYDRKFQDFVFKDRSERWYECSEETIRMCQPVLIRKELYEATVVTYHDIFVETIRKDQDLVLKKEYHKARIIPENYSGTISIAPLRADGMLTSPPMPAGFDIYLDSAAGWHAVYDARLLINRRDPPTGLVHVRAADGTVLTVGGYGDIQIEGFNIPNVCLVERLTVNVISVGQLARNHNVGSCFFGNQCDLILQSDGSRIGGAILRDDNQYMLQFLQL